MSISNNSLTPKEIMSSPDTLSFGEEEHGISLAQITGSAAFSLIAPKIKAALDYMDQPGSTILETLTDNIQRLQDAFVDALYTFFERNAVSLEHKLTLCLDEHMRLAVNGDHPDKEQLNTLLAPCVELSAAFQELAAQSAALRDLYSLQRMIAGSIPSDKAVRLSTPGVQPTYQVSIKGDMNHFYFYMPLRG